MVDGAGRSRLGDDLHCCGHSWRLHTPTCHYWYPGTRQAAPQECGCDGTVRPAHDETLDDPTRVRPASSPAR
ncbi:hypothetical protein WPS_29670 [Vulcanimicrobium alpinum]|uniref:Uncharacterized protein n=1 Tax=Vulcanimicrobium alpinum TaxID=3016050 RepID=A0AAN2CB03_UNVUL|nr:hypothetical protein [Vulcanimicrobium alpinum]BDE07691.1 hypothetical protein WPS_29670 [Vulcanimicrobium alpinum]